MTNLSGFKSVPHQIRIDFDARHAEAAAFQQHSQGADANTLSKTAHNASSNHDILHFQPGVCVVRPFLLPKSARYWCRIGRKNKIVQQIRTYLHLNGPRQEFGGGNLYESSTESPI